MTDQHPPSEPRAADHLDYFSRLESNLEQLAGEEAWTEFQQGHFDTPEYRDLISALMA